MTSGEGSVYRLDSTHEVNEKLRELATKSAATGRGREFRDALQTIVAQLTTRPRDWGDPERQTRQEGGWVCHGLRPPLFVQYVVFEDEKVVCILKVQAWPDSPLTA